MKKLLCYLALFIISYYFLDSYVVSIVNANKLPHDSIRIIEKVFSFASLSLSWGVIFLLTLLLRPQTLLKVTPPIFSFLISFMVVYALKIALGRARPSLFVELGISGFYPLSFTNSYFSMPSSHSCAIAIICSSVFYMTKHMPLLLIITFICVGMLRVLSLHHHLSDVLIGGIVGFEATRLSYKYIWASAWLAHKTLKIKKQLIS